MTPRTPFDKTNELNDVQFNVNEGIQSSSTSTFTDLAGKSQKDTEGSTDMRIFPYKQAETREDSISTLYDTFTFCMFESDFLLFQKTLSHDSVTSSTSRHR